MQVTETLNEGLKREVKIVVPAAELEEKLMERLVDAGKRVRLNGFRPGKVPVNHLRRMYGKSFMAEIVNETVNDSTRDVLQQRGEKAAMRPDVSMTEDEAEAERILAGEADFTFSLAYEVIPQFELQDVSDIAVERAIVEVPAEEIEEQMRQVAESTRSYTAKDGAAGNGDRVTMDFVGRVDGEAFEGGSSEDASLVLGSGRFIPGFEEQLVGVKAGDEKTIKVTFPEEYGVENLAGKEAEFEVKVKEIAAADPIELNDALAESLGLESLERLQELVRGQLESQYGNVTRQKLKRQILDALDARYDFEPPSNLVNAEFDNIWQHMQRELEQSGRTFEDEGTSEEAARDEYRKLAERRVRLGLVLAKIGEEVKVEVSDDELQRAIVETARQYRGQEQQVFEFYMNNANARADLRAPLFEEKVIDHLIGKITVNDKVVSKEELLADEDEEESLTSVARSSTASTHDHDHDHDHDHEHDHDHDHEHEGQAHAEDDRPEEKPAKKKPAARKKKKAEGES